MNFPRFTSRVEATAGSRVALRLAAFLWIVAMAVILVHAAAKPNANTLYKVFRAGGARWLASQNLYPKVDEYIYSPLAAAGFAPLALLPDRIGGVVWRLISLAAYAGGFVAWLREDPPGRRHAGLAWVALLPLSVGDLFNGQANPLVIGLLMLAVLACRRGRWMAAAMCVAVPTYFKVYPLAIGLLLAVLYPARFPWRLALALAGLFALSLCAQRPMYALEQYRNWAHTLGQDPRRTLHYFGTYRDFWLLLRLSRIPISLFGWAVVQAATGAGLAAYLFMGARRGWSPEKSTILLLALGACWMLLFGPATESSTYVMLAPPLILAALIWWSDAPALLPAAGASYTLLIASQMLSSWAHQLQNAYTHTVQPAAALIFACALAIYGRMKEQPAPLPVPLA